jgi:hypothetical protein
MDTQSFAKLEIHFLHDPVSMIKAKNKQTKMVKHEKNKRKTMIQGFG